MFGLVVCLIVLAYLALAILMFWSIRKTAIRQRWPKQKKRGILFLAVFVFYMIPFWDFIPTLIAHEYYCESEAGFFSYKTVEKWSSENPGVLGDLRPYKKYLGYESAFGDGRKLNERFASVSRFTENVFLSVRKYESKFIDVETGEVLAEFVKFSRGYGSIGVGRKGSWKIWLRSDHCFSREASVKDAEKMRSTYREFNAKEN